VALGAAPDPFADRIALTPLAAEPEQAVGLGRAEVAAKHDRDALGYFLVGMCSRPNCLAFCASSARPTTSSARPASRYLVQRPFGANADVVRSELAKDEDVLGTLIVSSS